MEEERGRRKGEWREGKGGEGRGGELAGYKEEYV